MPPTRPCLFPAASFNPLHHGHRQMAEVAAEITRRPVAFELSVVNVDKPVLSAEEVRHRLRQFTWDAAVWLTQAPTFADKAALFPGVQSVVGADTAACIVDPQYYQNSPELTAKALERIRTLGCRFLVAGRTDDTGRVLTAANLDIPAEYQEMFVDIPASAFRANISSTRLGGDG